MSDRLTAAARRQGVDYSETESIQRVHAAIRREKREPGAGREPLSLWLIAVYGLAIFVAGLYFGRYAGDFSADGLDPRGGESSVNKSKGAVIVAQQIAEISPTVRGKKTFLANCATCHQPTGAGVAGQYPPLAGSEYVTGGTRRLAMIVLKGLQGPLTVKGIQYGSAVMQPWEKTLSDAKIAEVLTYIRSDWGNTAPPVAPEGVRALRKELAGRAESWTEADLAAVPADANLPGGESSANAAAGAIQHVVMQTMKFNPATLEIKKGDVVEWKNEDFVPHTATSKSFGDSGSLEPEKSWRHTFTEAGQFPYACTFHPDMKAVIIVK